VLGPHPTSVCQGVEGGSYLVYLQAVPLLSFGTVGCLAAVYVGILEGLDSSFPRCLQRLLLARCLRLSRVVRLRWSMLLLLLLDLHRDLHVHCSFQHPQKEETEQFLRKLQVPSASAVKTSTAEVKCANSHHSQRYILVHNNCTSRTHLSTAETPLVADGTEAPWQGCSCRSEPQHLTIPRLSATQHLTKPPLSATQHLTNLKRCRARYLWPRTLCLCLPHKLAPLHQLLAPQQLASVRHSCELLYSCYSFECRQERGRFAAVLRRNPSATWPQIVAWSNTQGAQGAPQHRRASACQQ
jgi:hypothetical protein